MNGNLLKKNELKDLEEVPHSRPHLEQLEIDELKRLIEEGSLADGRAVNHFQNKLTSYLKHETVIAPSGRKALTAALLGIDVSGHEVVLPTYVCEAVYYAVLQAGARPVLADNAENKWTVDMESNLQKVTSRTAALVKVHPFGINPFEDFSELLDRSIAVIEDLCQAFSPTSDNADAGVYSFFATKEITTGQGGAVSCSDKNLFTKISDLLRDEAAFTPMTDLQASLGVVQLEKFDYLKERRDRIMSEYLSVLPEYLCDLEIHGGKFDLTRMILWDPLGDFERRQKEFAEYGITIRRGVDALVHRKIGLSDFDYPNSVNCFDHTISIPAIPSLTDSEVERVTQAIKKVWR